MARQRGVFPISGKLDEVVFYKGKEGFLVKKSGALDKEKMKTDPRFAGSRKANTAFGRAAAGTRLLRKAMGPDALVLAETRMAGKMNGKLMRVLKEDMQSDDMDEKLVSCGNLELLVGHAWDAKKPLRSSLLGNAKVNIDRKLGELEVHFESFLPARDLKKPKGASHYELFAVGAALDFEDEEMRRDQTSSGILPINKQKRTINLSCHIGKDDSLALILGLGITFYQERNDEAHRLVTGGCFEIVGVG